MDDTSEVLSRDGAYRLVLTLTDRDLAMHANAYFEAPELFEVASGRTLFSLDRYQWTSIITLPWGESGFQLRLAKIKDFVEFFLILEPALGRSCLSKGFEGQMWNDEIPDRGLRWQFDWAGINAWLEAQYAAG